MIGRAVVPRLRDAGWEVRVGSRGQRPLADELAGAEVVHVDRKEAGSLEGALGDGVDVLVDVISMTADDAAQLLGLAGRAGSLIAISSASVYADDRGRTLDEASGPDDFPEYPLPMPETQRTVEPGADTYSTNKAAMERALLEQDDVPATVIRPCAIHGPGDRQAREWFFVKRALDGRSHVVLAYGGASRFHTTCSANLGELVALAAERPGTRALNCGDPDPPTVLEISRAVAQAVGHDRDEVTFEGPPEDRVGSSPWAVPDRHPLVVDMAAAERELGYRPVTRYDEWVERSAEWLLATTRDRDWREALPAAARYFGELFDYEAEDAFMRRLAA